jgi:hypothetical protein
MKNVSLLLSLLFISTAHAEKWNRANNPDYFNVIIGSSVEKKFDHLPLKASLKDDRYGWSESYWPSYLGGIAYRWNHPNPNPFKYELHTKEELLLMNQEEISQLSPAELYDIAMGDYSYKLTRKVLKKFSPDELWWEGICHGWSLSALNYPEPDKTIITNSDGIKVPFGSSDVKALLSMHDAFNSRGFYVRVGERCSVDGKVDGERSSEDSENVPSNRVALSSACRDVNPGAFHIVLGSLIGLHSKGFVADVDRFNDVWNQPVTAYESESIASYPLSKIDIKNGVTKKILVKTKMIYGEELQFFNQEAFDDGEANFVSKEPVTGTSAQAFKSKNYEYILELNKSGEIIGGEWLSETRPDMIWMKTKDNAFNSNSLPLAGLNRIYKPVTRFNASNN